MVVFNRHSKTMQYIDHVLFSDGLATPTASCCGISLADWRVWVVFLLTWCLDKNIDTVVWAKLVAFLFTAEDLASLESVVFGPWITQRKKLYNSFGRCSSSTSRRDPLDDQGWALLIAFLSTDAASYKAFISASWIAASLVHLMLTHSGLFACLALWNSTSGISLWRSFFNFRRLQVGFLTLFADRMLVYVVWSTPILMILPSSSSPLTKLRNSTSAANSSALQFSGTGGSDGLRRTCVTYFFSASGIWCRLHEILLGWYQYLAWHRVSRCLLTQLLSWE